MKFIELAYDHDAENPSDFGEWKVYSFSKRHNSYMDPDNFFPLSVGMRRKLQTGTAFLLSYFEHGQCQWSLKDEGMQCKWDSVSTAGIVVWEAKPENLPKGLDARKACARAFLEEYTAWCNGEVYGFAVESETGDVEDSCWGFYDLEYMASEIRMMVGKEDVKIKGELVDLASYHKFTEGKQELAQKVVSWR